MDHIQHHGATNTSGSRRSRWALLGFLAVAGFFLWTEHKAHLLGVLPYLLVLACPLMHLLHQGHGHGGHRHTDTAEQSGETKTGAAS